MELKKYNNCNYNKKKIQIYSNNGSFKIFHEKSVQFLINPIHERQ